MAYINFASFAFFIFIVFLAYSARSGTGRLSKFMTGSKKNKDEVLEIEKANKRLNSIGVAGLLTKEELEDEANYVSKFSENSYIQNNTKPITHEICVLTPSFSSDNFISFAQDIFERLVTSKDRASLGSIVNAEADLSQLPETLQRFDVCFIHNYIVKSGYESIKLLITVNGGSPEEKYFLTFTRKNPAISVTKGEPIAINCPNCGGNISFAAKHMITVCPYCNNTVTFAEYDWTLTAIEHINGETVISNRAVIKQ